MSLIIAILAIGSLTYVLGKVCVSICAGRFQQGTIHSWVFAAVFFGWIFARPHIGFKAPGHWFERGGEYRAELPVSIFPSGSESKNYRVTGGIHSYVVDGTGEDNDGGRCYSLEYATFPNGGRLTFEDSDISPYGRGHATDARGNTWGVELAR